MITSMQYDRPNAAEYSSDQPLWQRIILLCVIGYEAAGCLLGGSMLVIHPDGRLMDMPVEIMHGAFADFLVPGIILFGLGVLNTIAFIAVLKKQQLAWLMSAIGLGGLAIWFWVEIAVLEELHWLHAMWGLPVALGGMAAIPLFPKNILQTTMLVCGILSSLLYVAINVIVPGQWPEYNSVSQTVSELSAVDAPTRMLWIVLSTPYTLFVLAFAMGILKSAGENRRLRTGGGLLLIYGALGLLWPFAPMHLREALAVGGGTISDTLHLILGAITEIIYVAALLIVAAALGGWFRSYSIGTLVLLIIFGFLTFREAPNLSVNEPTPYIGVWERINIGLFLLWVIVLAIILLFKTSTVHDTSQSKFRTA